MASRLHSLGTPLHRVLCYGFAVAIGCVAAAASVAIAAPPLRAERIATRRLERIEVLERRAEAAAEMPPRPADVRRLLRRGVPLSEIMPPAGRGGPAAAAASRTAAAKTPATAKNATAARPAAPAARGDTPTPPAAATTAARSTIRISTTTRSNTRLPTGRNSSTPAA